MKIGKNEAEINLGFKANTLEDSKNLISFSEPESIQQFSELSSEELQMITGGTATPTGYSFTYASSHNSLT